MYHVGMHDPRFDKLAKGLVSFSTELRKGEKVLIDAFDIPAEMTIALVRAARAARSRATRARKLRGERRAAQT